MSQYFSDQLQELQEQAATSELAFRRAALEVFRAYGLPRRKQDPWKYVDNSALLNLPFTAELPAENTNNQSGAPNTFCFHNGVVSSNAPDSVRSLNMLGDLDLNPARWHLDKESLLAEENSYSLINAFSFSQAYELKLSGSVSENAPSIVWLCFSGKQTYQAPRLYIEVPARREVCLLLDSSELGPDVYWNPYFSISLGENARLTLLDRGPRLQSCSEANGSNFENHRHVRSVTLRGRVAAGGQVNSALFYWGTALAIHDARFAICGEAADVQMHGLCFGEGRSNYHLRCENQHLAPNSKSQCLYKNVLFDKATSEFYGIIHAGKNGIGTDAVQQNQNLLLSDGARAIARPQLEILVDDLKCRHGSSTGSIDAEELFYMRSRGLDQGEAMRLAVVGFVEEISVYFAAELLAALGIEDCLHALLDKRNG